MTPIQKSLAIAAATLLMGVETPAHAAFLFDSPSSTVVPEKSAPLTRTASAAGAKIVQTPGVGAVPPAPTPDLAGFQEALSIEPVLAQHGVGIAGLCHESPAVPVSLEQALKALLPEGWKVYTKPGVLLGLDTTYSCKGGKPWTTALREALNNVGLHGAIWWGPNILTLWVPTQPKAEMPNLSGYQPAELRANTPPLPPKSSPISDHSGALTVGPGGEVISLAPGSGLDSATRQPADDAGDQAIPLSPRTGNAPVADPMPSIRAGKPIAFTPVWTLKKNMLIAAELTRWARQSGWTVVWQVPEDWQVPNTTTFSGDFQQAVSHVIQALSANGANVHAVFHTANNTVVISGAGGGE
jgi:hypothetical protein